MKRLTTALAALVVLGILAGCGGGKTEQRALADRKPDVKRESDGWMPPQNWSTPGEDANGERPEDVLRAYLEARKAQDWAAAWERIVSDGRPELETWRSGYVNEQEQLVSFEVGESRSGAPGVAVVRVGLKTETDGKTVEREGEWWNLRQDQDGTWKVTLREGQ